MGRGTILRGAGTALLAILALTACAPLDESRPSDCGPGAIQVGDSGDALQAALDAAQPGDLLQLADVTYRGRFTISSSGGDGDEFITLCGSPDAVIDGGTTGYALHLDGASHWALDGFAVTGGTKGIMLDGATSNSLHNLDVSRTGQEGIHLRRGSTHNSIVGSAVHHTGLVMPAYGEGVYIGSAQSNWCEYTACAPDASDHNTIIGNHIYETGAEAIDAKEGTRSGTIRNNVLAISATAAVDSVVDLKGNDWVMQGNRVSSATSTAVQVHAILDGWGLNNTIAGNTFVTESDDYVIDIVGAARSGGNVVACDNETAAGQAIRTNVACADQAG